MEINTLINLHKLKFDKFYSNLLNSKLNNGLLTKAMKYSSINGGKRIRAFLVSQSSKMVSLSPKNALIISSAIESIHAYSLIHDDLPSMDNDDFRRGKLSAHKKFNEATAILAGDALHDFAFQLISGNFRKIDPKKNLKLINYLTMCTGCDGLAGGQTLDLLFEKKKVSKKKLLKCMLKKLASYLNFLLQRPLLLRAKALKESNLVRIMDLLLELFFK